METSRNDVDSSVSIGVQRDMITNFLVKFEWENQDIFGRHGGVVLYWEIIRMGAGVGMLKTGLLSMRRCV